MTCPQMLGKYALPYLMHSTRGERPEAKIANAAVT
jgi:hypothetical protein